MTAAPPKTFDHIIIGAGSAGCTLANRLSADPNVRVLVLEAGGWDRHPFVKLPLAWGRVLLDRIYDWGYDGEPQDTMAGRRIECARGKVIGGSSTINAMAYVRGNRGDYARWASYGLPGWSYDDVLPYFRRQESWEGGATTYRGGDGPLQTRKSRYQDPLVDAYLEAAASAGHVLNDDYNGETQDGFARMQMTIRRGFRDSAATAYLHPVLSRANLTVKVHAHVTRVVLEGARAVGVEYLQDGRRVLAHADGEVILSGGAINSPQVLMLSGIGDPQALRAHGINIKVPLPGVGRNLQDHPAALLIYARGDESPLLRNMRVDRLGLGLLDAFAFGRGFVTDLPGGITGFVKTDPALPMPDIQLLFIAGSLVAAPYLSPFRKPFADSFACRIVLLRPESRGAITLASSHPLAPPHISQGLLSAADDWKALRRGIALFRDLAHRSELKPFVARELGPGPDVKSDAKLEDYVRRTAVTAHHPSGTCKMGPDGDAMAVVDGELRVRGTEGLRVVDASVFPDLVGGNINAPTIMIAERAADFIHRGSTRWSINNTDITQPTSHVRFEEEGGGYLAKLGLLPCS
ncbi:MAG TPA: GMC family oxidoreductase N-terminal domain-containing protein [Xanthobacteraceae bacterium]|nr:GMC family oxidoreductase N-terminal domain-containing protein [Xanthobacteraceae bacterium]